MDHVPGLLIALDNLYLLVSLMPRAAPRQRSKMDGSFVSLITEKARFAEWKKRMGVQRAEDLKALSMKLPADAQRSPATILAPVQEYITLSDQLFEKYGVESANGMKKKWSFRAKLPRVDEFVNGHQGLEDMLAMLKNCNDELSEIVPLVPGRYVSLVGGGHVLVTTNDAQYLKLDTLLQPQPSSSESHSDSPTMNDGCAGTAYQNVIAPTLDSPVEEPTEKVDRPVIQLLHSTCLGVIRSMAVQYLTHQEELNRIGDRLAIWGSGLFRAPVPIDEALLHHPDTRRMKFLRGHIAGILADVTVALRHILSLLGEPNTSTSSLELVELLSDPEMASLPLKWFSFKDEDPDDEPITIRLDTWCKEAAALVECLFINLDTIEMVLKEAIFRLGKNPVTDESVERL